MRKIASIILFLLLLIGAYAYQANARMTQGIESSGNKTTDHTKKEEAEGKEVWEKLQSKELACDKLSDENFAVLGEYFMGRMMGDSHSAMNEMMARMQGEQGETAIHVVMGKRLSGCDTAAAFPLGSSGWLPMMQMMWGGWSPSAGFNPTNNSMMNFGYGFGIFSWLFMLLWWVFIIVAAVALVKWLAGQFGGGTSNRKALDILKERYAKGEIDQKELEEKKRNLAS